MVNTFMSVYFICGVAVIMWIIVGYSLSFPVTFGDCSGIYTGRCFATLTSCPDGHQVQPACTRCFK
ncbi:hypothetical protein [Limosilactobacillus fermentum]